VSNAGRRHPNVVNIDELKPRSFSKGERFAMSNRVLGRATGAKTAFPNHYHCANEESVYILEGSGSLRIGADTVAVRAGDYATFPIGPEHSHQLLNTGPGTLRYLCFSTMTATEVVGYPDSKKIGALGFGPNGEQWLRTMSREGTSLDYYDGELPAD
jgi:uncharacterized cupin superfamily protein